MDLFESFSGDPENSSANSGGMSGGISRRSVMKAGAAAAWSVPLVQVVAAAPAVAVSGPAVLNITGTAFWGPANQSQPLNSTIQVANTGGQPATVLTVVVTFPAGYAPTARAASLPSGWIATGNGTPTITFSSSSGALVQADSSFSFSPTFDLANPNNRGKAATVGLTANASGGLTAAGTLSLPKGSA